MFVLDFLGFEIWTVFAWFCYKSGGIDCDSHIAAWICSFEMLILSKGDSVQIREVWNDNLEEEFMLIHEIVDEYNYVAMDTKFHGVVLRPMENFKNINDYNYQTLKDNVDMLKLIQLGLTFSDENGNLPTCGTESPCIWQFNFREFNISEDIFALPLLLRDHRRWWHHTPNSQTNQTATHANNKSQNTQQREEQNMQNP